LAARVGGEDGWLIANHRHDSFVEVRKEGLTPPA
jgi:hypothetical protein